MTQSPNESLNGQANAVPPGPDTPPPTPGPQFGNTQEPQAQPVPAPGPGMPPPAPVPPASGAPVQGFQLPSGLNPATWWTGAAAGAGAYVAVLVLSVVAVLLFVVGLAASGSGDSVPVPDNPIVSDGDLPSPWSILFQLAAQLPALAMLGSLGTKLDADLGMLGQVSASFGVSVMPLLVTAAAAVALFIGARLAEKRLPSGTALDRLMQSVVAGAVFALLLNVVATVAAIRIPIVDGMSFSLNAANFGSVTVAFLLGALASFAGRNNLVALGRSTGKKGFALSLMRDAGLAVTAHLAVFLVVAIPVVVIVLGVKGGWAATLSAPLWAPTVGLVLLGLGHLAAFGTVSNAGAGGSGIGNSNFGYGVGGALAEFGVPVWAGWLLVLLALVAVAAAATYWYLRRGVKSPTDILGWVALPAAFFVAGALLLWFSGIHASFNMAQGSGSVAVGLAWWTPFLMLLWGAAVEAASRYLAPVLAPLLPAAVVARIQKSPSVLAFPRTGLAAPAGAYAAASADQGAPAGPDAQAVPAAGAAVPAPAPSAGQFAPSAAPHPAQPQPGLPGTAAIPAPPVMAERKPLSKKAKRNLALSGGAMVLVGVLVGGGAIAVNAMRSANGPDKVVQDFLGAMVDGNAERALEIADPSIPNASRVLLTNEIYAKATHRPDGFTVLKTTMADDVATVSVELRQNGVKSETSYRLVKTNPTLLDNNWKLKESGTMGTVAITASTMLSTVLVNGVSVSLAGLDQGARTVYPLPAFPGTYDLTLPATSKFMSTEPVSAVVSIQGDGAIPPSHLSTKPNDAFDTAVKEKVSAMLTACAGQKSLKPENCPFSSYEYSDVRNVAWKITQEPTFEIYSQESNSWRLSTGEAGEAAVTYERDKSYSSNSPEWEKKTDDTRIYLDGTVTLNKDELTVEFNN